MAEIVAHRKTYDGIAVALWSDGLVTGRTGERITNVKLPTSCMWRAAGDFSVYTWAELPAFIRKVAKLGRVPHTPTPTEAQFNARLAGQVQRHVHWVNGILMPVNPRARRDVTHETFAGDVWLARAAFGDRYCRAGLYTVWRGDTRLGTNLTLEQARALARRASSGRDRRRRLARRDEVRTTVTGRQASSSPLANPHDRVTGWRPAADGSLIHREWKDGVIVTNARAWDWAEVNEDERHHLAKRRRRR